MSLISKIKEALGITAMEAAQAEARREATAARKAAAERDERLFALMDRLLTPNQPAAHIPSSDREAELINQIAALQSEIKQLQEEKEATSKAAVDAFLASLSAKTAEGGGKVGRPRKDGTKVTLRIDAQSWALSSSCGRSTPDGNLPSSVIRQFPTAWKLCLKKKQGWKLLSTFGSRSGSRRQIRNKLRPFRSAAR
jgi:hypothetical protein